MYLELVGRLQILWTKSIWKEMSRTERCTQPSARDASPSPRGNCNSDASWPAEVLSKSFPSSPVACFAWFCENWSFSLLVLSRPRLWLEAELNCLFLFFLYLICSFLTFMQFWLLITAQCVRPKHKQCCWRTINETHLFWQAFLCWQTVE